MIGGGGGVELLPVEPIVTGESYTSNMDKIIKSTFPLASQ